MIVLLPDPWGYYDVPIMHGSAHGVSADGPEYDAAEAVRKVAEEVSGKNLSPKKASIGFIDSTERG